MELKEWFEDTSAVFLTDYSSALKEDEEAIKELDHIEETLLEWRGVQIKRVDSLQLNVWYAIIILDNLKS